MRGDLLALGAMGALALAGAASPRGGRSMAQRTPYRQKTVDTQVCGSTFSTPEDAFEYVAADFLDTDYFRFFGFQKDHVDKARKKVSAFWKRQGLQPEDAVFAWLTLYVQADVRGRGMGRAAVERLEAKLVKEGVRAVILQAGQPDMDLLDNSLEFWKHMGYQIWPGAYPSYFDDRLMFKVLPKGSRAVEPFALHDFKSVEGRFPAADMDELESDLETFCRVLPGARRLLPKAHLELRPLRQGSTTPQGWYFPDQKTIRLLGFTSMVCHEAVHHLDRVTGTPSEQITWPASYSARGTIEHFKAGLKASPHYLALEQALMVEVPSRLRAKVMEERIFLPDALRMLSEESGHDLNVDQVARQILEARGPFGGVDMKGYRSVPEPLLPAVRKLAGTLPAGIPFSLMKASQADRQRYFKSVSGAESVRNFRSYYLSYHEMMARLVDQFVRRRAVELGRKPPGSTAHDVPEELFLRFEEDVERQVGRLGWR